MRLLYLAGTLAAASCLGSSAYAQESSDRIIVEGKRKPDRKICKVEPPPTGSRMGGGRVCRTAADWKMDEQLAQRSIEHTQSRSAQMDAYNSNKGGLADQGPP